MSCTWPIDYDMTDVYDTTDAMHMVHRNCSILGLACKGPEQPVHPCSQNKASIDIRLSTEETLMTPVILNRSTCLLIFSGWKTLLTSFLEN